MARSQGKAPSQRQLRVGESVRHELAQLLGEVGFDDPALAVPITVTEVRMSPDLKHATAFVLPLGGGDAGALAKALTRAGPALSGPLGRALNLKYAPRLHFQPDESFDEAAKIDRILASPRVQRDLAKDED